MIGEPGPPDETIELDDDRWIVLVFDRKWPKYVVSWSIRRRSGESDFPIARGEVDGLPSRDAPDVSDAWAELRQRAVDEAMANVSSAQEDRPKSRSLMSRLFSRSE